MLITDQDTLEAHCAAWARAPRIAVDTEFLREKTYYAKLCLIQISAPGGPAAAVDPLVGDLDLGPVLALLRKPGVLKVFHAAKQDLEIFHTLMRGDLPAPLFDTQLAAMVLGYGEQVGYEAIVHKTTGATIDKGAQFTDWSRRPLSDKQLTYALGDVTHLLDVYEVLRAELEARGRAHWIAEEEAALTDPAAYEARPQDAWQRIKIRNPKPKNLVVLRALAAWREDKARASDRPRGWIVRDEALAELATRLPTTVEELCAMRGIPEGLKSGERAQRMLARIAGALDEPRAQWPALPASPPMPADGAEKLELYKMLRRVHAARLGVAPRLLASGDDLRVLARDGAAADIPLLRGWRREVSGAEMLRLSTGSLAIGLKDGAVAAIPVEDS